MDLAHFFHVLEEGMTLNGGGTAPPPCRKPVHILARANFHSVSEFSWKGRKNGKLSLCTNFILLILTGPTCYSVIK